MGIRNIIWSGSAFFKNVPGSPQYQSDIFWVFIWNDLDCVLPLRFEVTILQDIRMFTKT